MAEEFFHGDQFFCPFFSDDDVMNNGPSGNCDDQDCVFTHQEDSDSECASSRDSHENAHMVPAERLPPWTVGQSPHFMELAMEKLKKLRKMDKCEGNTRDNDPPLFTKYSKDDLRKWLKKIRQSGYDSQEEESRAESISRALSDDPADPENCIAPELTRSHGRKGKKGPPASHVKGSKNKICEVVGCEQRGRKRVKKLSNENEVLNLWCCQKHGGALICKVPGCKTNGRRTVPADALGPAGMRCSAHLKASPGVLEE